MIPQSKMLWKGWRESAKLSLENSFYRLSSKLLKITPIKEPELKVCFQNNSWPQKPKGSLVIGGLFHDYSWELAAFSTSLSKFGDFIHFDPLLSQKQGEPDQRDPTTVTRIAALHSRKPFDVLFCYLSPYLLSLPDLKALRQLGIPMINLNLNDKEAFVGKIRGGIAMGSREICRYFDLCWTSTEDSLIKYAVEGAKAIYLPEAANPEIHHPVEISQDWEVSFLGACYGERPGIVQFLRGHGIKVETRGLGWPEGKVTTEEMKKVYSRSRINLGFAAVGHMENVYCLKGRDFEVPMSGGLYLTQDHEELHRAFEVGQEIMTYRNQEGLLDKIRWLLAHPKESAEIAREGRARCLREHTWEARFDKIFSIMGLLSPSS